MRLLTRLLEAAARPVVVGGTVLQVSASLGVTFFPQAEAVEPDQLLRQADQAMYQAKLAGKNRYHVFDADLDSDLRVHHESLQRIQLALAQDEFVLHYQPKVCCGSGRITGVEALIRWHHPQRGLVPPDHFIPLLEETGRKVGKNIYLAFSPERIDPGNPTYGIKNTPKIVGGVTEVCGDKAVAFYEQFIETVVRAKGTREAETAKLLENTYRHINIALVNEMAQFAHAMDIDIWNVVELAKTKPFGFQSFSPSAGVGGHCIPIDPNYLAYKVRAELERPFRFVELAEEINHSMPPYVARRVQDLLNSQSKAVKGSKVLLLGVTYKANISDKRESPAVPLGQRLLDMGAELSYFDPHVPAWGVNGVDVPRSASISDALQESDVIILVQPHREFIEAASEISSSSTVVLDTTGKFTGANIERL